MNKNIRKLFKEVLLSTQMQQLIHTKQHLLPQSPEEWHAYWTAQGQPWRTEPEIGSKRQQELSKHRTVVPDPPRGIYPFKDMKLSRADVEWLLATHEDGRGPVDWNDENQLQEGRVGLDLRGADLSSDVDHPVDLRGLPLTRLIGGPEDWERLPRVGIGKQWVMAIVRMEGVDLREAHLEGAHLLGAHLEGAILEDAHLEGAYLGGAQLKGAFLNNAHLEGTYLSGADLENANLNGADLRGANLNGAQLQGAYLQKAQLQEVHLREAQLQKASFMEAHLENAILVGAQLEEADLHDAQLEKATLYRAQMEKADLSEANLKGANLSEANLEGADLSRAHLEGANLHRAQLKGADLSDANLEGANLSEANLEEANLEKADLKGADLREVQLKGTHLQGARLEDASLIGARLEEASLRYVILGNKQCVGPQLADVQWGNTNLAVVKWSQMVMPGDEYKIRQKSKGGNSRDKREYLEKYQAAVRANRQLSIALQDQGLNEDAARFAYRAQVLQRKVLWKQRNFWKWLGSAILALLAGYGYRMWRILVAYLIVVFVCAIAYFVLSIFYGSPMSFLDAVLTSITAFHGRVFAEPFTRPGEPQLWVTAFEAIMGLVIEGVFIAMLTQKFFGK